VARHLGNGTYLLDEAERQAQALAVRMVERVDHRQLDLTQPLFEAARLSSMLPPERVEPIARRLAGTGVAVTVLPATDLYLMGRAQRHNVIRGVLAAHELLRFGVNCSLSTNNVLNPFTPFGDGSLVADYVLATLQTAPQLPPTMQLWAYHLYCVPHSGIVAGIVTWLAWFFRPRLVVSLLGWWSHIFIDVFTHSSNYY
jgi:hypothetical protein